jgi:hypothetical protein
MRLVQNCLHQEHASTAREALLQVHGQQASFAT